MYAGLCVVSLAHDCIGWQVIKKYTLNQGEGEAVL